MDRRLQDIQEILELHRRRIESLEKRLGSTHVAHADGQTWYDSRGRLVGFKRAENSIEPYVNVKPKSNGPTPSFPIALILTILDLILVLGCVSTILNPPTYTVYRQPLEIFGVTIIEGGEVTLTDWGKLGLAWIGAIFGVLVLFFLVIWTIGEALGG